MMIKIVMLNSNLDDLIVIYFDTGVGVLLILNWVFKELKSTKNNSTLRPCDFNEVSDLDNYTFNFKTETGLVKKTSLVTKITLFSLSVIIAVLPFYEFVETLRPEEFTIYWSCFPG